MAQDDVSLYNVILYDKKRLISKKAEISLYGDRITLKYGDESVDVRFSELSAASVLGKNKMNLYYQNKVYQIKGAPDFCALKYVNIYYRFAYLKGENKNEFMGL